MLPLHTHRPTARRRTSRRRTSRRAAAALVAAGALVLVDAPAQAHDALISTNPADKSQVAVLPDQVVLTFEEPPLQTGSQVLIKGPNGAAATGPPMFSGDQVTQAVAPGSPAGTYTVTWRVTSDDGHAVFGTFAFTAAAGNAAASTSTQTSTAGAGGPSTPAATGTSGPAASSKSTASKAVWLLVLLALLVPIGLFLRRGRAQLREMGDR